MLWLRLDGGDTSERARKKLKHAAHNKGDFNHDLQLHLRVHLAMYELGGEAGQMREQLIAAGEAAEADARAAIAAAEAGGGGGGGGAVTPPAKPTARKVVEL